MFTNQNFLKITNNHHFKNKEFNSNNLNNSTQSVPNAVDDVSTSLPVSDLLKERLSVNEVKKLSIKEKHSEGLLLDHDNLLVKEDLANLSDVFGNALEQKHLYFLEKLTEHQQIQSQQLNVKLDAILDSNKTLQTKIETDKVFLENLITSKWAYLLGAGITFATLGVFYYWKVDKPDTNDGSPLSTAIVESITKRDQVQTITEDFTIFGGTVSLLTKTTTTVIRNL